MSSLLEWVEPPRVEWHGARPFVFARLSVDYARELEKLAHHYSSTILTLPGVHAPEMEEQNPTASRYPSYNVFLLDGRYLPLFLAIREAYRVLVKAIDGERQGRFIKCWYNVTAAGYSMARHKHRAVFIGTFAARADGSSTRFGMSPTASDEDHIVENKDGQLLLTVGMNHHHEVSVWEDSSAARVTYAFDIVNARQWRNDRVQIPFDGGFE